MRDMGSPKKKSVFLQSSTAFSRHHVAIIFYLDFLLVILDLFKMPIILVNMSGPWSELWAVPKALPRRMWLLGDGRLRNV